MTKPGQHTDNVTPLFSEDARPGHPAPTVSLSPGRGGGGSSRAPLGLREAVILTALIGLSVGCFGLILLDAAHVGGLSRLWRPLLAAFSLGLGLLAVNELLGRLRALRSVERERQRRAQLSEALMALTVGMAARLDPDLELDEAEGMLQELVSETARKIEEAS